MAHRESKSGDAGKFLTDPVSDNVYRQTKSDKHLSYDEWIDRESKRTNILKNLADMKTDPGMAVLLEDSDFSLLIKKQAVHFKGIRDKAMAARPLMSGMDGDKLSAKAIESRKTYNEWSHAKARYGTDNISQMAFISAKDFMLVNDYDMTVFDTKAQMSEEVIDAKDVMSGSFMKYSRTK